jgi:AraC family transcriptional regulator of adaptative response / DNA-3-methyladenine glycosylase II
MDDEHCYRVASGRDGRFDGTFVTAVLTTGIYCRPSCPAMTPQRQNVRFYPTPAAAQDAGFRACKRCRPDAAPGSPEWDARADVVARAVRLIGDGVVEREGVGGLAHRLSYTPRQVHRLLTAELGTGPLRLAMAHRVQNAWALLENTDLPVTDVAWAAGFGSIRQFNDRIREVFAMTPSQIRAKAAKAAAVRLGATPAIVAHLTYRPPLDLEGTLAFLGRRAVPGVESWDGGIYQAALDLPHGFGVVTIPVDQPRSPERGQRPPGRASRTPAVDCQLELSDIRDYSTAVSRVRRLLDLDADPAAVAGALGDDPLIGTLVAAAPGRRVPGTTSPFEMAVRAIIGQQVSVPGARRVCARIAEVHGARIAEAHGTPVADADGTRIDGGTHPAETAGRRITRLFPNPEQLAQADPSTFPLPARRIATVKALAAEVAAGRIQFDPGADRDEVERQLLALPGIGPWTAAYIRMRAFGDPDVFVPGDLVLDRMVGGTGTDPSRWKPWRSYAAIHLWTAAGTSPAAGHRTAGPSNAVTDPPASPSHNEMRTSA